MARAIISGRIDCKTAGRLAVHLQTMSKLLWMTHRKGREGRKGRRVSPQICADERRSSAADRTPALKRLIQGDLFAAINGRSSTDEADLRVACAAKLAAFPDYRQDCRDGSWVQARAA